MHSAYEVGLKIEEEEYKTFAIRALKKDRLLRPLRSVAQSVADKKAEFTFFHWQLEFPDIFQNGSDGFDVVMGNPPYVTAGSIGEIKSYLKKKNIVYSGNADLYTYFVEKGIGLLRDGGTFGMIISNKCMRADYGQGIRNLVNKYQIEKLIDFGELPVFEGSATFPLIISMGQQSTTDRPFYAPMKKIDKDDLETDVNSLGFQIEDSSLNIAGFTLVTSDVQIRLDRMNEAGTPLGEYVDNKIYYGVKTGFNKAFIIDKNTRESLINTDPASAEIIKPFVMGDDVRKYQINYRERYLILTKTGVEIERYPKIFEHLQKFQPHLEKRLDKGKHWWELRACTYYSQFERPKII